MRATPGKYGWNDEPRTTNIAMGNVVVGQQIGGRDGVEAFAWVRDAGGHLWVLNGKWAEGGLYRLAEDEHPMNTDRPGLPLHALSDITAAGPAVTL